MFQFQPGMMYQMPVHFGPCCGPRQDVHGARFFQAGPQESTLHTLVYETDTAVLESFLPAGFTCRAPYVLATHKEHRNLPWLAGRGYNVTTFNTPVFYAGKTARIQGQYQLAIWENHADPILCGREQLGYAKIYADISDMHTHQGKATATLSSWDFCFLELDFHTDQPPEEDALLDQLLNDPEGEGLLHYKYIPRTGDGFCQADAAYVTLTPKQFPLPQGVVPPPAPETRRCTGSLTWHVPRWEDMPTQYHIIQGLSSLPIRRVIGARRSRILHYNDVYHQQIVE